MLDFTANTLNTEVFSTTGSVDAYCSKQSLFLLVTHLQLYGGNCAKNINITQKM